MPSLPPTNTESGPAWSEQAAPDLAPPRAPIKPRKITIHGTIGEDPYAWLRDEDDPDACNYLRAETDYAEAMTRKLRPSQFVLYEELRSRIAEDDCSVPQPIGDFIYYSCSKSSKEYEIHYRRQLHSDLVTVVLDENELAGDSDYFELGDFAVCPQHRLVAYTVDKTGDEFYRLYVKELVSGQVMEGPIENVSEDVCWCENAKSLYYVRVDDNGRPYAACLHVLGTPVEKDRELFEEDDPAFFVSIWKSRSKAYVFIESHSNTTSEVHYIDVNATDDTPRCFRKRQPGIEYVLDHRPGEFLVLTNINAPNFRLVSAPETHPDESTWRDLLPHSRESMLEYIDVYANHTVIGERRDGLPVISILAAGSTSRRTLKFAGTAHELEVEDLHNFDSDELWVSYSSPTAPDTIYACPFMSDGRRLIKTQELEGFEPQLYSTERLWVTIAPDLKVPVTLTKKKSTTQPAPVLLQGYGAYEECYELYFDSDILSLLDRGVILATAHVRGGGELGRSWYTSGKLMQKENSFTDFLACTEFLIDGGYTTAGRIALRGSSAGGLLVAVAMQRRPELFAGVVAEVPFVDVVNTLLDDDAPLTQHDIEEFGDPKEPNVFQYLLNYSPYENVRPLAYPPLLVTAALEDQRVGYWEPLKWVAKLRATKTDRNPVLLKVEEAGHYGQSGRYQELKNTALIYAFLLECWGINPVRNL